MHFPQYTKRIIISDGVLCKQNYNDLGEVSHTQLLSSRHLLKAQWNQYIEEQSNTQTLRKYRKKSNRITIFRQLHRL